MQNIFSSTPVNLLTKLLKKGKNIIGEIALNQEKNHFFLRHRQDLNVDASELKFYSSPEAAREIARYDAIGNYRPLKTARTLARGWLLQLGTIEEVALALDFFYPAALNLYDAWLQGTLEATPLRETLSRQTGMYRITQLLTDEQAQPLIAKQCYSESGCLRKMLWSISLDQKITSLPEEKINVAAVASSEIPLLCREACNLLVAAARDVVKKQSTQ